MELIIRMTNRLKEIIRLVVQEFNLKRPVHVELKELKGDFGDYRLREKGGHHIRIHKYLDHSYQIETFLHEFAHAMVEEKYPDATFDDHGAAWGIQYAKVYRFFSEKINTFSVKKGDRIT